MAGKRKNNHNLATTLWLVAAVVFALVLGGCADTYYVNNGIGSPEAKYNTYYARHYYPYYPWYAYYGGAYYYGNE